MDDAHEDSSSRNLGGGDDFMIFLGGSDNSRTRLFKRPLLEVSFGPEKLSFCGAYSDGRYGEPRDCSLLPAALQEVS